MAPSKVYFTDFRTHDRESLPQRLRRLIQRAGMDQIDFEGKYTAIKIHFGEMGNLAYLRPNYARVVVDFVKQLVANLGISAEVTLYHCEDNSRRIVISGEDAAMLIGHHGEALDSLQYLANLASTKKNANGERNRRRVTIDIEGYRAKREETLRALARKMAAKALRQRRNVMLEPMSAYERRIIHSEIQGIAGVSTNSIGSDNNRKIVIYLVDEEETVDAAPVAEAVDTPVEVAAPAEENETV